MIKKHAALRSGTGMGPNELLLPIEMGMADKLTIESNALSGYQLMLNAGQGFTILLFQIFQKQRTLLSFVGPVTMVAMVMLWRNCCMGQG